LKIEEKDREIENIKKELLKGNEVGDSEESGELKRNLEVLENDKKQSYAINQSLSKMLSKETALKKELQKEIERLKALESERENMEGESRSGDDLLKKELLEKKDLIENYEKKFLELKKTESLYKQLRNQFEEKKKILDRTRRDLFHEREKLVAINVENERNEEDQPEGIRELQKELASFEAEIEKYEEENKHLQDLVTDLTEKLNLKKVSDIDEKLEKKINPKPAVEEI
jgi:hypothetical protein